MKTIIKIVIAILTITSLPAFAGGTKSIELISKIFASGELREGAVQGFVSNDTDKTMHLLFSPAAKRQGSFIGLMLQTKPNLAGVVYVVDPLEKANYILTPFTASDSHIGLFNDNPSMQLTVAADKLFVNPVKDSQNNNGFQANLTFDSDSTMQLVTGAGSLQSGNYVDNEQKISIGSDGKTADMEVETTSGAVFLRGKYALTEDLPGIFVARGRKVSVYGAEDELRPQALLVQMKLDKDADNSILVLSLSDRGEKCARMFTIQK